MIALFFYVLVALGAVWAWWRGFILFCWLGLSAFSWAAESWGGWASGSAVVGVVPDGYDVDRCGQPLGDGSNVAEFRRVPVTAHLCARPRPRAVWVKRLETVLGAAPGGTVGELIRGRWTPDLPSEGFSPGLNLLLAHRPSGVKILGGGSVCGKKGDDDTRCPYFVVECRDGNVSTVFPDLLSCLSSYAFLRAREATLVLALRSRAIEWCKKQGMDSPCTATAVETAVAWAWEVTPREVYARGQLLAEPHSPWWS